MRASYRVAITTCCLVSLIIVRSIDALACPIINKIIPITANEHVLTAEIAANRVSHQCGLAFRTDLPDDHGMLFVYARDRIVSFWMKDTSIPLSIAFLDRDGRILEIHDMYPLDSTRYYFSKSPVRYALEVNQGWFSDNGIEVGDRLEFDRSR
ncbi:MAG: DUF192 domain-containing protein [Gammaproteobacteria bacterium]|nr:DUF192 domain-containing protein [Gammaproteobacteria bacterium]